MSSAFSLTRACGSRAQSRCRRNSGVSLAGPPSLIRRNAEHASVAAKVLAATLPNRLRKSSFPNRLRDESKLLYIELRTLRVRGASTQNIKPAGTK